MKPPRRIRSDQNERTQAPFPTRLQRGQAWLDRFHLRDYWWRLLDFFEASRARRIVLYAGALLFVGSLAAYHFAYPWWERRNSIRIAQQWLAAGQLRNAADAAQRAAQLAPDRPEPWLIAAELARLGHQEDKALEYARRAAELAPADPVIGITWAAAALRAGQPAEADRALDQLPVDAVAGSADAQRIRGEIARRDLRLTPARHFFEAAQKIEGPKAVNEVPLGLILLNAVAPAERQHGLDLLAKWTTDRDWGVPALRVLLEDALTRHDLVALLRWGEALRNHPGVTTSDMPRCLQALALADPRRYREVLAGMEKDHSISPTAAAQLLSWLNQIGEGPEAARWMKTLPPTGMDRPPLVVAGAEALRQAADWSALAAWTGRGDWGAEAEFLRWTFGLQAARQLGDNQRAEELWRTLYSHAQLNGTHGMFAAASLYSWGRTTDAETLWWRIAEQDSPLAIEALGSLARHYQVNRDAEGQYRAFRRLHLLLPQNPDVGNNFAFFALLLGREQRIAAEVARTNAEQQPENLNYLATQSFALSQQGRYADSLALLKPKATLAGSSSSIAFAYGLALAGAGRKDEARPLLDSLPPGTLTITEVELIRTALKP